MTESTAKLLVDLLAQSLKTAADAQLKLAAFERVMESHNPSVCASWRREIENLRKQQTDVLNPEALNMLREQLRQE